MKKFLIKLTLFNFDLIFALIAMLSSYCMLRRCIHGYVKVFAMLTADLEKENFNSGFQFCSLFQPDACCFHHGHHQQPSNRLEMINISVRKF